MSGFHKTIITPIKKIFILLSNTRKEFGTGENSESLPLILSNHAIFSDDVRKAMSIRKIKAWLLKLGLVGFMFFFVKGLLWIAVLWFGVKIF